MYVVFRFLFVGVIVLKEEFVLEIEYILSNFILRLIGDKLVYEFLIFMIKYYICLFFYNFIIRLVGGN